MNLEPLEVKTDRRGSLVEAFKLGGAGQVHYVVIRPNETRGNHYHKELTEKFIVIWGSATATVKNRETGDVIKVETSGQKPMLVTVVPNHTHTFTATDEGALLLAWSSNEHDPDNPDTYPEEV